MGAPREITDLIERFSRNADSYRSDQYGETEVRVEFIDPFFKCLGWDIHNTHGFAEAYKDVIHEDAIKVGGYTKAPDYCFRIGGTRKFFLEAKRPSIKLKTDPEPAFLYVVMLGLRGRRCRSLRISRNSPSTIVGQSPRRMTRPPSLAFAISHSPTTPNNGILSPTPFPRKPFSKAHSTNTPRPAN